MMHLGDITKIHGDSVPIADVIIGGSPCQDLSIAGKREGLLSEAKGDGKTTRSGLFIEQVRIVKEMRDADRRDGRTGQFIRPRFMVWENVPGAFSSNGGEDFWAVLEETARIAEPDAAVPRPEGGWKTSGCIMGNGWSIAWRVLDAQFWGVPQRRRRIALVADFGGYTAPEILFERNGLCWDTAEGTGAGEGTATGVETGAGETSGVRCMNPWDAQSGRCYSADGAWHSLNANENGGQSRDSVCYPQIADTLTRRNDGSPNPDKHQGAAIVAFAQNQRNEVRDLDDKAGSLSAEPGMKQQTYIATAYCIQGNCIDRHAHQNGTGVSEDISYTLNAVDRPAVAYGFKLGNSAQARSIGLQEERLPTLNAECGGNTPAICYDMTHASDVIRECGETAPTLQSRMGTGGNQVPITFGIGNGQTNQEFTQERTGALNCMHDQKAIITMDKFSYNCGKNATGKMNISEDGIAPTHGCTGHPPAIATNYTVRRLTPLECERLQGYPDGWTDIGLWTDSCGKLHKESSDSARYKALGNSIALPPWKWVLKRISALYERDATMASLFDGIGGFPYIWEQLNGKGSCLWASEIEEFPIAVTKKRFWEDV